MNERIIKTKSKFATLCFRSTSSLFRITVAASIALLVACSSGEPIGDKPVESSAATNSEELKGSKSDARLVATITTNLKEQKVYEEDIESLIALRLFDLDWAKYELKREALAQYLSDSVKNNEQGNPTAKKTVTVTLQPPIPPRIKAYDTYSEQYLSRVKLHNVASQPSIGSDNAKVEMSVFCNYQSIHCARMAKTYEQLNDYYPEKLKFVYYDFPQKFHRYSAIAAQAARCADQNQQLSSYQSALWASQSNLQQERLIQLAKQLGISEKDFEACMAQDSIMGSIKANMQLATDSGLTSVPVTLINGLYLNGPKSFDDFRFYIDHELEKHKGDQRRRRTNTHIVDANHSVEPIESQLALRLENIFLEGNESGMADIRLLDSDLIKQLSEDDEIMEDVYLVLIEQERVIIENNGHLEFLTLSRPITLANREDGDQDVVIVDQEIASNDEFELAEDNSAISRYQQIPEDVLEQDLEYKARPIVASAGSLPLSKSWVDEQLQNQAELSSGFQPAAHEVEGKNLLKLRGVAENEFFQTLGLQEGDAVMRVNGEWVHEQHNNLFDVLENEDHLSIVVMRKGLPVHLEYAIR